MKHIEVVCAVIEYDGKFLCMQRANRGSLSTAGKWEFPGGKIEPEESQESALRRELQEEMDYEVDVVKYLMTVCHQYPDFHITMHAYLCMANTETFNRKEHINHKWLHPAELSLLDWADADAPIIKHLTNIEL